MKLLLSLVLLSIVTFPAFADNPLTNPIHRICRVEGNILESVATLHSLGYSKHEAKFLMTKTLTDDASEYFYFVDWIYSKNIENDPEEIFEAYYDVCLKQRLGRQE